MGKKVASTDCVADCVTDSDTDCVTDSAPILDHFLTPRMISSPNFAALQNGRQSVVMSACSS